MGKSAMHSIDFYYAHSYRSIPFSGFTGRTIKREKVPCWNIWHLIIKYVQYLVVDGYVLFSYAMKACSSR